MTARKLTTAEVAAELLVTRHRVAAYVKSGKLTPVERYPKTSLFALADVRALARKLANDPRSAIAKARARAG